MIVASTVETFNPVNKLDTDVYDGGLVHGSGLVLNQLLETKAYLVCCNKHVVGPD
jgi:hypothetical protein